VQEKHTEEVLEKTKKRRVEERERISAKNDACGKTISSARTMMDCYIKGGGRWRIDVMVSYTRNH